MLVHDLVFDREETCAANSKMFYMPLLNATLFNIRKFLERRVESIKHFSFKSIKFLKYTRTIIRNIIRISLVKPNANTKAVLDYS